MSERPEKVPPPDNEFHRALREAFFWDTLIQNNALRFSVHDLVSEDSELTPGTLAALEGFWRGKNKAIQEKMPKPKNTGDSSASRRRK